MRWFALLALLLAARSPVAEPLPPPPGAFIALCYHEVRGDVRDYPDPYAVDDGALVAQFSWLRGNGYTPVSLDDIVAARRGGKPLPAKAVLLTFDDGYLSFYTRVYPLLRAFGYPAVLGVVGSWIEKPQDGLIQYGEKGSVPQASFPTWAQLREMAGSGLVEIASHSWDLHRGVQANPQGNFEPAATARLYDPATGRYEGDAGWRARVKADLARNAQAIERETGRRPRAIAWPYGSYNDELVAIAGDLGSSIALTLGDGWNTAQAPLTELRRVLVGHNPSLGEFIAEVRGPEYPIPLRALRISLDQVYSTDPAQQESNLSTLLDRIQRLKPTHVYLQAYADTNGDGVADAVYFPNRHVTMRADLFNRVAWQIESRTEVKVMAVLPIADFRLAPQSGVEVYEDLARHADFDGLLFDRDAAPGQAEIVARVRAFRAPLQVARVLDTGPLVTRLEHRSGNPGELPRIVYLLRYPTGEALAAQMRALQLSGALDFAYAPDDFRQDQPPIGTVAPSMSLRIYLQPARP